MCGAKAKQQRLQSIYYWTRRGLNDAASRWLINALTLHETTRRRLIIAHALLPARRGYYAPAILLRLSINKAEFIQKAL